VLHAGLAKLYGYYKAALPLVVGALILFLILDPNSTSLLGGRHPARGATTHPAEFMYLDSARVDSYLSQVKGGEIGDERVATTTTQNASRGLELNTVGKADASTSSQLTTNVVVTQTAADRFQTLQHETKPTALDAEGCSFAADLSSANTQDGKIVKIEHAVLELPPYLSAYPELRYATFREPATSPIFAEVPLGSFHQVDESARGTPARERRGFKHRVGPNPRLPFSLSVWDTAEKAKSCQGKAQPESAAPATKSTPEPSEPEVTVVMPARFANLTGDPSLLSVQMTIVGIVVGNHKKGFGDGTSLAAYWPALSVAKAPLLRELGVKESVLKKKRIDVRKELFNAMKQSVTFPGHVVEIVPIAMYD
jgi:hypothetical protein